MIQREREAPIYDISDYGMGKRKGKIEMGHSPQLHLKTSLKAHLVMTQGLRQALEILQMPHLELAEWLREEIEKNPLLELETTTKKNSSTEEIVRVAAPLSLHEHLMAQIREAFPHFEDHDIAIKIMELLDERGFIVESIEVLELILDKSREQIKTILEKLQTFDPPGIFAHNLKECLLIQLKQNSLGQQIVGEHFDDLLKGKFKKIKNIIGEEEFIKTLKQISRLNFRPVALFSTEKVPLVKADLSISKTNNVWVINTIEDEWPKFQFHEEYLSLKSFSREEKDNLRNWAGSARSIFRSLKKRQQLLIEIGDFLVRKQKSFLDQKGELAPLTVQDLAEHLQVHESTVSRALSNKYAMTPRGFLPLHSLFCASPLAQTAKLLLEKLVATEDKKEPLTDEELMKELKAAGVNLSRRTVVKYRHQMKINAAAHRKNGL